MREKLCPVTRNSFEVFKTSQPSRPDQCWVKILEPAIQSAHKMKFDELREGPIREIKNCSDRAPFIMLPPHQEGFRILENKDLRGGGMVTLLCFPELGEAAGREQTEVVHWHKIKPVSLVE